MRNYSYDCRKPCSGADLVERQLRLSWEYQTTLLRLAQERYTAVEAIYVAGCPTEHATYVTARDAARDAATAVYTARSAKVVKAPKGDKIAAEELKAALKLLDSARDAEKAAMGPWLAARKALTPSVLPQLRAIETAHYAAGKLAYNDADRWGLAWGTRLAVAESVERAAKDAGKHWHGPIVQEWDGSATIAVQLQGGLAPDEAMDCEDTRLRLEIVSADEWQRRQGHSTEHNRPAGKYREKRPFAIAHLRVGSDEHRAPIWALFPFVLHRPLPEGAPIKWAKVRCYRVGQRTYWQLLITIDDETPATRGDDGMKLAVNFGWRRLDDGASIRVAFAVGSDGKEWDVRVPPAVVAAVVRSEEIGAQAKRNFEVAKNALVKWLADHEDTVPDWLTTETQLLSLWRSPERLHTLAEAWSKLRFDGDVGTFEALGAWWTQHQHLRYWESDLHAKALRQRKQDYSNLVAAWAKAYSRIYVTDMDLRDFAERPAPEDGRQRDGSEQRRSRNLAAPSSLRGLLRDAAVRYGAELQAILGPREAKPAKGERGAAPTQTHNACGVRGSFNARSSVLLHCLACGDVFDQDRNHCQNLLASAAVMTRRARPLAPSVTGGNGAVPVAKGRWGKRRSQTAAKVPADVGV